MFNRVISTTSRQKCKPFTRPQKSGTINLAKQHNMFLHGWARLAVPLSPDRFREFTSDAGVDVLSFGGTKNGMLFGESVIFFNPGLAQNFKYIRKQGMQLASKMRFISVQFEAYLDQDIWRNNARHANDMAKMLYMNVSRIAGIKITQPVEANAVFAILPADKIRAADKYFFYIWDEALRSTVDDFI
jgi:threonine aldolase